MGKCIIKPVFASWISVQALIFKESESEPPVKKKNNRKYAEIWPHAVNIKDLCLSEIDILDSVTF